jgi:hypothetical protein
LADVEEDILAAAVAVVVDIAVVAMAAASHSSGIFYLFSLALLTFTTAGALPFSCLEFSIVSLI